MESNPPQPLAPSVLSLLAERAHKLGGQLWLIRAELAARIHPNARQHEPASIGARAAHDLAGRCAPLKPCTAIRAEPDGRAVSAALLNPLARVNGDEPILFVSKSQDITRTENAARSIAWMLEDARHIAQLRHDRRALADKARNTRRTIEAMWSLTKPTHADELSPACIEELLTPLVSSQRFTWGIASFDRHSWIVDMLGVNGVTVGFLPDDESACLLAATQLRPFASDLTIRVIQDERAGPLAKQGAGVVLVPLAHRREVFGALLFGLDESAEAPFFVGSRLIDYAKRQIETILDNVKLYNDLRRTFIGMVESLSSAIDAKDPYTSGHSDRVAYLSRALALAHGMSESEAEIVRIAGLVHDVGKIGVPEHILSKRGPLTASEFAIVQRHPEIGYRILRGLPPFETALPGVLYHHEHWDGGGYPAGLSGADIPLTARIISLCDAVDAMSSTRSYRPALTAEEVKTKIRNGSGRQFDPDLVTTFQSMDLRIYHLMIEDHLANSNAGRRAA